MMNMVIIFCGLYVLLLAVIFICIPAPDEAVGKDDTASVLSDDMRRAAIRLDDMIMNARGADGRQVNMTQVGALADAFAQQMIAPEIELALMMRHPNVLAGYPYGYWALGSALMCEVANRRTDERCRATRWSCDDV